MKKESDTCLSTEEEKVGLRKLTNAKTNHWLFTDNLYAYENLQDHNTKDVNVDMETNKDSRPITNELFLRAGKLKVLLDFLLQSCLKVAKS